MNIISLKICSHNESEANDLNSSKDSGDSEEKEVDKAAVVDVEKKMDETLKNKC